VSARACDELGHIADAAAVAEDRFDEDAFGWGQVLSGVDDLFGALFTTTTAKIGQLGG